jgi:hypothetical protein
MKDGPKVIRVAPLVKIVAGELCWLVLGSLEQGKPEYRPDAALAMQARGERAG